MMFTKCLFVLSLVLFAQGNDINPYDLEDEVKQQAEDLQYEVRGAIFAAFGAIDNSIRGVYRHRDGKLDESTITIQQEFQKLDSQLTSLKDLALEQNQEIDICLADSEALLYGLPKQIIDSFLDCIIIANVEVTVIQNDARYYTDTLMSEVTRFEWEIDMCAGDFSCLSSLVTEIELAKINVPQKIGVEVDSASDLCEDLKVLIESCADSRVAQFVSQGGIILKQISTCVDRLLS